MNYQTTSDVAVTIRNGRLNVIGGNYMVTYFLDENPDGDSVRYALYRFCGNTCWLQRSGFVAFVDGDVNHLVQHAVRSGEWR